MEETSVPYVVFLPKSRKRNVLRALFGSSISLDIVRFSVEGGIPSKILQKDLIENLGHSNKSIINHLNILTEVGILEEHMEKTISSGRTVWLKSYTFTDLGKWFAFLLVEEEKLSREEKIEILGSAFRSYIRWVRKLSGHLGMQTEELSRIFEEEMEETSGA
ncbi:MAG: hypothetical protein OEZ24_04390 [Candidatus Bathyarchaeota archaeon]|nr:hypothetical protein [Candidatus Bathyarchaeota archaeon]